MTALAAGSTASVTLDANDVLIVTGGNANYTATPTTGSVFSGYLTGSQRLGPFKQYVTVSLSALTAIDYSSYSETDVSPVVTASTDLTGGMTFQAGNRISQPRELNYKALQRFRTALAGRSSSAVDILHIGDSITWGYKAGSAANRWASKLRDALRTAYPCSPAVVGGFGFVSVTPTFAPITLSDGFVTVSGGTVVSDNFGLDTNGYSMSATGHKITFTVTGTGFDILYAQYSGGGTFYYKVDGGANTNVVTNGATNYGARNQAIRGLAATSHTIEIGWVSGTSYCTGGFVYNGDESAGIRSAVAAWPSTKSSWWWNVAKNYWLESIQALQPALVTIELGPNDYAAAAPVSVATFKSNLQNIIAGIKSRCSIKPSFVLCATWPLVPSGTPVAAWLDYVNAMYEIAAEDADYAVMVDNWMPRTSGTAGTTIGGILDADTAHPSPLGNQYLADSLFSIVSA